MLVTQNSNNERDVKIDIVTLKYYIVGTVNTFFEKYYKEDAECIRSVDRENQKMDNFKKSYLKVGKNS